jgi:two-component system phosphate regulon sensor histidine kinase PhoR
MFERRSLKWPITLGVVMIVLVVALTVGWVLLAVFGAMQDRDAAALYWTLLTVGTIFLVMVLVGVVMYLWLSVKEINLNRRQANFVDSVTHELKSPIASLKLYLQTLNLRKVPPAEQENFYKYMLEDVERLDQLINHLLDAARLSKVPKESELESVPLEPLIHGCIQEVRGMHPELHVELSWELEPSLIRARRADLEMIFRNVIDNAFKYAGQPAVVSVVSHTNTRGDVITLIRDNGRGIPRRHRAQIFGRFVRLGVELERDKPGTGLGLHIVETLVRRLRGRISVSEGQNGKGTTFEIRLPGERLPSFTPPPFDSAPTNHSAASTVAHAVGSPSGTANPVGSE